MSEVSELDEHEGNGVRQELITEDDDGVDNDDDDDDDEVERDVG